MASNYSIKPICDETKKDAIKCSLLLPKRNPPNIPTPLPRPLPQRHPIPTRMHPLRLPQRRPPRRIHPNRLERDRRHIAMTQRRLPQLLQTMINMHPPILLRQPGHMLIVVIIYINMLAESVYAMQAMQHVGATVISCCGD